MDNPRDNPEYLKINEAARFLGVNPRTLANYKSAADLKGRKIGVTAPGSSTKEERHSGCGRLWVAGCGGGWWWWWGGRG